MGIELKWSNITDNWYAPDQWGAWQPDKNLNQLFSVVDRILDKTDWDFEVSGDSRPDSWYAGFSRNLNSIVPQGIPVHETRAQAIYAACLAAIDHINEEING